jgi:hypothetical protein
MSKRLHLDQAVIAIRESWSLRTSGNWLPDNPARGQCNVTAMLVHELFGGEILKTPLPEGDHYYNRLDGKRVDLTDSQFDRPIAYADLPSDRTEALMGTTAQKYEALRSDFQRRMSAGDESA